MTENKYLEGLKLLRQPVMPLVSMIQFLFMTGPFATVAEVVSEMPEPIETDLAKYETPRSLLMEYIDILSRYEQLKTGEFEEVNVVDENNNPVDAFEAVSALITQEILTRELEKINSALCAPCGCVLCCTGPEETMKQEFFEIPLAQNELDLFEITRYENEESLNRNAYDENELICNGKPFYLQDGPGLFHWRNGWSLIMPKASRCPNLEGATGRCLVYADRPQVCRRPQIFPYMLEQVQMEERGDVVQRIRQSLLAIIDCPYVRDLQNEIAEYAAACDLHLVLKKNKA